MRGSNPRLSAHKTDALTSELMGRPPGINRQGDYPNHCERRNTRARPGNTFNYSEMMTLVGLEPTISGSVDRCLIHWATGPAGENPG